MAIQPEYETKIYHSIEQIDKKEWDSLNRDLDDIFVSWDFCKVLEESFQGIRFFYLVVRKDNLVFGKAILCILNVGLTQFVKNAYKKRFDLFLRIINQNKNHNILLCGIPVSVLENSIRYQDVNSLEMIMDEVDSVARRNSLKIIIAPHLSKQDAQAINYSKKGFLVIKSFNNHYVDLKNKSFQEYYDSLTRNGKKMYRQCLKKTKDLRIVHNKKFIFDEKYYIMYLDVNSRAEYKLETLPLTFFNNLIKRFKDSETIEFWKDDCLIGYGLGLKSSDNMYSLFAGMDYNHTNRHNLIMNIMYRQIHEAIQMNCEKIIFGPTNDLVKQRIGCVQERSYILFKQTKFRLLSLIFNRMAKIVFH